MAAPQPTQFTAQLTEYDELEDRIEDAAVDDIWTLADWLVANVPNHGRGRPGKTRPSAFLKLEDLAELGRRGLRQLQDLRQVAEVTAPDRVPNVSVRTYLQALRANGNDLAKANAALKAKGTKLRDQSGPMESVTAIKKQLAKRSPKDQAEIIEALTHEPEAAKAIVKAMKPEARQRVRRTVTETEAEEVPTYVPSDDSQKVLTFQDVLRNAGASDLPARIMEDAYRLLNRLGEIDQFRLDFGYESIEIDDDGTTQSVNEHLDEILEDFGGRLALAFAAAKGAPDTLPSEE